VLVSFPTAAEVLQVSGSVSMTISDYIDASATITVEKATSGNLTHLNVLASNATAFLGWAPPRHPLLMTWVCD
jgi:hypothetical protein